MRIHRRRRRRRRPTNHLRRRRRNIYHRCRPVVSKSQIDEKNTFGFKHPFTMTVSGPTSCGKAYFVKQLLQNSYHFVQPTLQRIIWLYKRWQPLYDVIRRTVIPRVEFLQGVSVDLEKDTYFDTAIC